ncbi:hypothetical protein V8C40DRAFT_242963 [Trichoderma camerunense]
MTRGQGSQPSTLKAHTEARQAIRPVKQGNSNIAGVLRVGYTGPGNWRRTAALFRCNIGVALDGYVHVPMQMPFGGLMRRCGL